MLDIVPEDDQQNELTPHVEKNEATNTKGCEILKDNDVRQALKRRRLQYYDRHQQLELILAAQELFKFGENDLISTDFENGDIWKDVTCMKLLHEGTLLNTIDLEECKRARKRTLNYQ
jgi:hypothetical protein